VVRRVDDGKQGVDADYNLTRLVRRQPRAFPFSFPFSFLPLGKVTARNSAGWLVAGFRKRGFWVWLLGLELLGGAGLGAGTGLSVPGGVVGLGCFDLPLVIQAQPAGLPDRGASAA
jgi:hypothetical protein